MSEKKEFSPDPILNHMVHWPQWAEHFKDAEGDTGKLARMLGFANEEIKRLCKHANIFETRHAMLQFAFIETVERLPKECLPLVATPNDSVQGDPFKAIRVLNEWRRKNYFNIKEWDVP